MDDLEIIKLSEVSQTKKCKYMLSYVESKKNDTSGLIYQMEIDSQTWKTNS